MSDTTVEIARDHADPVRIAGLAALLDHAAPPWAGGMMPPLGHWLCFPPQAPQSALGVDGHPRPGGGLLPQSDLPRRMWAGSRVRFLGDVPIGSPLVRRTTLVSAEPKTGRSGRMLFATLRHVIDIEGGDTAIVEEQDIVYREPSAAAPTPPMESRPPAPDARRIVPDPVMLFRFSALTFNAHRIHYDRDYATQVEGYRGLVVHGPFVATLLLDHVLRQRPGWRPSHFEFRAAAPAFAGEPLDLVSRDDTLIAANAAGPCMTAVAR